jgi:hypothetical protein
MSFLKEDSGGSLKKHWNLVLEKWFEETLFAREPLDTCSCRCVRNFSSIGWNFGGGIT